jgi:hypothetical protein
MARGPLRVSFSVLLPCTLLVATLAACGEPSTRGTPVPAMTATTSGAGDGAGSRSSDGWEYSFAKASGASSAASASPSPSASPAPSGTARGSTGSHAGAGPDEVALAATRALFSWDTRVDRRPNDTARRLALTWLAPSLRQQVIDFRSESSPGADWEAWVRRHARARVTAVLGAEDRPADGGDSAYRQVLAVIALEGDGGWRATERRTVFLRLTRDSGRWSIAEITETQAS